MGNLKHCVVLVSCLLLAACSSERSDHVHSSSTMGIDAFGHTRLSSSRMSVTPEGKAHVARLIAYLRDTLPKYRSIDRAVADGYRPEGPDVPIGAYKHFVNYQNLRANWQHLDPDKPMALLYRRTPSGYELAGVMFSAPMSSSMDDLDQRIPLAYGHWHSHRNVCQPKTARQLTRAEAREFGFSGSINTAKACAAAGGVFLDNVFGWMVHVYPFENDVAKQF
jgi:hypothetical protein